MKEKPKKLLIFFIKTECHLSTRQAKQMAWSLFEKKKKKKKKMKFGFGK